MHLTLIETPIFTIIQTKNINFVCDFPKISSGKTHSLHLAVEHVVFTDAHNVGLLSFTVTLIHLGNMSVVNYNISKGFKIG